MKMHLATPVSRSTNMSRVNLLNCPCWDPWKIGYRRLLRARTGTLPQLPKSHPVDSGIKDRKQPRMSVKPSTPSGMTHASGRHKVPFRSRERHDISKDLTQVSAGYLLSHMKGQLAFTLEEESPESKESTDTSFHKPTSPRTTPQLQTEDVVADLVEQISELTGIMEQLRRDHETTHKQLENEMEEKCNELQKEHESKVRQIKTLHRTQIEALEEQYKKELRVERATAQEKLSGMQKEYKYLKNAFRVYQDSISDEMEEKWLRRQAEWKKSERTEREKALLQQKQSLMRQFENEMAEQQKKTQNNSFLVGKAYQEEKQDFLKQHEEDLERICVLTKKVDALEDELKEKTETLNAIASSLHNKEVELLNEKANVAEVEKMAQQRIASIEEKHRISMNALVEDNVALKRKLLEKNEELYNERAQRSVIF